jgi:hypothetical protein
MSQPLDLYRSETRIIGWLACPDCDALITDQDITVVEAVTVVREHWKEMHDDGPHV